MRLSATRFIISIVGLIRFIPFSRFSGWTFQKILNFFELGLKPRKRGLRKMPFRSGSVGEADSFPWATTPLLRLLLDLVNDHSAGLIIGERLRVIAIAGMHSHARRCDPAPASPTLFDCTAYQHTAY